LLVSRCGVGPKKAAAAAKALISAFDVSTVIMSGTAAGIGDGLGIGDTVVSTEMLYHDLKESVRIPDAANMLNKPVSADATLLKTISEAMDKEPPAHSVRFGRITTGSKFVRGSDFARIAEEYQSLCADMETAAVAHVCNMSGIPFIAVRSVSDTREESGVLNFFRYVSIASKHSFQVVERIL